MPQQQQFEVDAVLRSLQLTLSPNENERSQGERLIESYISLPEFGTCLARIGAEEGTPQAIRQIALVFLRKGIRESRVQVELSQMDERMQRESSITRGLLIGALGQDNPVMQTAAGLVICRDMQKLQCCF